MSNSLPTVGWAVLKASHLKARVEEVVLSWSSTRKTTTAEEKTSVPSSPDTRRSGKTLKWSAKISARRTLSWAFLTPVVEMFSPKILRSPTRTSLEAPVVLTTLKATSLQQTTQPPKCRPFKHMLWRVEVPPLDSPSQTKAVTTEKDENWKSSSARN